MSEEKTHDLYDFIQQLSNEMAAEYDRIRKRATEDPGTAGDQGEENWTELLRGWLPSTYKVVTKGKIISQDGITSPQVDVLVLKDVYPEKLLNRKLYLAAGVAAAFECKTTLKAEHIAKTMETCVRIKNLYPVREGTPYKELYTPIVYGLLAHSHSWKAPNSRPENNIEQNLLESDYAYVSHPRHGLDLLCVADLGTWVLSKFAFKLPEDGPDISANTTYCGHTHSRNSNSKHFNPIGTLISRLTLRLAWEDSSLRDLADYYSGTSIEGGAQGYFRKWHTSVYKPCVRPHSYQRSHPFWDEWSNTFL